MPTKPVAVSVMAELPKEFGPVNLARRFAVPVPVIVPVVAFVWMDPSGNLMPLPEPKIWMPPLTVSFEVGALVLCIILSLVGVER
jgi:hypothetical protein